MSLSSTQRRYLERRWLELERELAKIRAGRTCSGVDAKARAEQLSRELDDIEGQLFDDSWR